MTNLRFEIYEGWADLYEDDEFHHTVLFMPGETDPDDARKQLLSMWMNDRKDEK